MGMATVMMWTIVQKPWGMKAAMAMNSAMAVTMMVMDCGNADEGFYGSDCRIASPELADGDGILDPDDRSQTLYRVCTVCK